MSIGSLINDMPIIIREIVEKQYELQPEFKTYGIRGYQHSLDDAKYNLDILFETVQFDSKTLFYEYIKWVNILFAKLKMPSKTLENFYLITLDILRERTKIGFMDDILFNKIEDFITFGIDILKESEKEYKPNVTLNNPYMESLSAYRDSLLSSNRNSAFELILNLSNSGIPIEDLFKYIFQPFQLELGNLWHIGKISVAQEHYGTAATQFAMSLLYDKIFSGKKNGKVLLGTCVTGELHEIGIRMVCDYVESKGWNTHYLGSNMPENAIVKLVKETKIDIIAISCTMMYNLSKAKSLINAIQNIDPTLKIIIGGFPFTLDKGLWRKMGVSAVSETFEETYKICEALTLRSNEND